MEGTIRRVLTASLLACSLAAFASGNGKHVTYGVDAATTNPPATVIQHGQGLTVVIFKMSDLDAGGTFTFSATLGVKGKNLAFPMNAMMSSRDGAGLTVAFDPATMSFPDATTTQTTIVTVTLAPGTYSKKHLQTMIKADPASGMGMGKGPGIKVIIAKETSTVAGTPEQQILKDVTDGLAPEAGPEPLGN